MASCNRRDFLLFITAGMGAAALKGCEQPYRSNFLGSSTTETPSFSPSFKSVKGPMPLPTYEQISGADHQAISRKYGKYEVIDDLVLPEGFTYDVIASWGDPVGDSRCGYNNDYLSFVQTGENQGFLTVNFEYISGKPWGETYEEVIGISLPIAVVKQALEAAQSQS
ncbi:phosphatase, partial [Arthrospira sp. O9.13F]